MTLTVRYFAWLRERIGQPQEEVHTDAATVMALVDELRARSASHAHAFEDIAALRVALDQELADFSASLSGVSEVAFFPPMTGG